VRLRTVVDNATIVRIIPSVELGKDPETNTATTDLKATRERAEAHATVDVTLDSLQLLLQESRRWPLLRPDEEIELAKAIERGDLGAKERMINSNLRLVISIARHYQGQGLGMGDLAQEGMLGLIRAVEKFDWRKGFRFSTYATLWIRQSIQRGLENSGRTVRLPVHVGQRARKVARIRRNLTAKLGRDATDEEVAEAAELPLEQVIELQRIDREPASLDQAVGEDGETPLGALIATDAPEPDDEVADTLKTEAVQEAIEELPEHERTVIQLRFGTAGEEPQTLTAIGRQLGITSERTRQLEEQALQRLSREPALAALREAA
jgi:RNA polymerase primary sigma factor